MKNKYLAALCLTFVLLPAAFGQNAVPTPVRTMPDAPPMNIMPNAPQLEKGGYLLGPGDVIAGKILGESQFDFTARIDEDGKFQVPFFDKSVMAKCKTDRELRGEVTKLVSKYLKNPLVSVSVTERKSRPPATIYGQVRSPQQITLTRNVRLLELLALAGGVDNEKAGGAIQIFHTQAPLCDEKYEDAALSSQDAENLTFPYRIYSLNTVQQGSEESNPLIYPGDIIVVKEALPVFIIGEVNATGKLSIPEGGLPLSEALARVGGVRPQAKIKDIKIQRFLANSKEREIISINYDAIRKGKQKDFMLSPYDIVEVGTAPKSVLQTIIEIARGSVTTLGNSLPQTVLR